MAPVVRAAPACEGESRDSDVEEVSDEALCERVAHGDDEAFERLLARHRDRALRLAWSIVRHPEDARDLSQEAFIRLYRTAGTFHRRSRFSTWFYRIVVNVCLDHRRKHRWWRLWLDGAGRHDEPGENPLESIPAPDAQPDAAAAHRQAMSRVWAEMERLSPQQRAALSLQLDGLETPEIATVLGCSEATVRVHLHRGLSTLRKTMSKV